MADSYTSGTSRMTKAIVGGSATAIALVVVGIMQLNSYTVWKHQTTPAATPGADEVYLYPKNDNTLYIKNSAGTETQVGGSSIPALTDGQLIIGSTGVSPVAASLTGTSNRITVTGGAGTVTLSAPQDIHTAATPTFGGVRISDTAADNTISITASSNEASNRTLSIPSLGANDTLATLGVANTFSGANTFPNTGLKVLNPAATFTVALTPSAEVASRTLTIPLLGAGDIIATLGVANTFTGLQTSTAPVALTGAAGASPAIFRQTGGVAGTDEIQISHNGTDGKIESKDGNLALAAVGAFPLSFGGTQRAKWISTGIQLGGNQSILLDSSSTAAGTPDAALARSAAGVVKVTDASTGIRGLLGGGTAVASATALPLPTGNLFHVTGTTNVTSITSTNFQAGVVVTLIFDGILTFTHGSNIKLSGAANFTTAADDRITMAYDGTNWFEVGRSTVAAAGSGASLSATQTFTGINAFSPLASGTTNNAIGVTAGDSLASGGTDNTLIGANAGTALTTEDDNTLVGYNAGASSTAANMVGIGSGVFPSVVTGTDNMAIGKAAGTTVTSGTNNIFIGNNSASSVSSTSNGIAIGYSAKTSGSSVFIGNSSGTSITGALNVAIGYSAGSNIAAGVNNVMVGANTSGANPTSTGVGIGSGTQVATNGVSIGGFASPSVSGTDNTVIGKSGGASLTTGTLNTIIGASANVHTGGATSCLLLGESALSTASNQMVAGSSTSPLTTIYIGNGVVNTTPQSTTLVSTTGGSGSNKAGTALQIAGGAGTGTGAPGTIAFQVSTTGSTGSTLQTQVTRMTVGETSVVTTVPTAIVGTTTNNNASAGQVGEYVESKSTADVTIATTATFQNFTSISLTAGDWDVTGTLEMGQGSAVVKFFSIAISTNTGNTTTDHADGENERTTGSAGGGIVYDNTPMGIPSYRLSLASTTTVYLKGSASWTVGSAPIMGAGKISARRRR